MERAFEEAEAAAARGEVPVGAVVYDLTTGAVLAAAGNEVEARADPTAHAEVLAIRTAGAALGSPRLPNAGLIVTLEPCVMCAAAIAFARLGALDFAAADPKGGGVWHGPRFFDQPTCHHKAITITQAPGADRSAALLRAFFQARRK
jgi:tRNA(Arg) A34 adenosine deaminase TadA